MKRIYIIVILLVLLNNLSNATEGNKVLRVAILDPHSPTNYDPAILTTVRELISNCFVNQGQEYSIVERSQLDKVMQEAKFSNSDAVDESQATELGRLAGADKVVVSVISNVGERSLISLKLINVETANIEKQQSKLVDAGMLLDVVEPITKAILGEEYIAPMRGMAKEKTLTPNDKNKLTEVTEYGENIVDPFAERIGDPGILPYIKCDINTPTEQLEPEKLMPILDVSLINVVYDWSDVTYEDTPFDNFMQDLYDNNFLTNPNYFTNIDNFIMLGLSEFINNANKKLKDVRLSYENEESPIRLIIKFKKISNGGNVVDIDYTFIDVRTKTVLSGFSMESKFLKILLNQTSNYKAIMKKMSGGPETMIALIGSTLAKAGGNFGDKLNKALKETKKKVRN